MQVLPASIEGLLGVLCCALECEDTCVKVGWSNAESDRLAYPLRLQRSTQKFVISTRYT